MCVGVRRPANPFQLQGQAVPFVSSFRYLGVVFHSSGRWREHAEHLCCRGQRRFYQFLAWSENRQLHTGFRESLLTSCVLPSVLFGSEFLDVAPPLARASLLRMRAI
ncbi:unnamed protein product [Polarella glacialis]|uniref:Uncharacterized protein n=1 Tax=Polarella glacialis TaxID=89957 RepID=A0A813H5H3_POLGL|nr:unnamed protein product [Polarella glacialis]